MRMNKNSDLNAKKVLNSYPEQELVRVFQEYGEIRNSRSLAAAIISRRSTQPFHTTSDLTDFLSKYVQKSKSAGYFAQVFQAIRIEVNDEIGALHEFLTTAVRILKTKGRLVVISYHSLEDRPVKNIMQHGNFEGKPEKDFYGNLIRPLEPVTRKPITASEEEINKNKRARSAKLRIAEKL
jgi:16S rRNA (cytosine1402-N4)-methyltransferase